MLNDQQNEKLTRVGPGTPMGELLRRYWHPVAPSAQLHDEPVKAVRLLGEDYVLFRDKQGKLGCIEPRCAHRQVELKHGFVVDEGLRWTRNFRPRRIYWRPRSGKDRPVIESLIRCRSETIPVGNSVDCPGDELPISRRDGAGANAGFRRHAPLDHGERVIRGYGAGQSVARSRTGPRAA
jgi:hypothetical protein